MRAAFTLIELLYVVAVIGILIAMLASVLSRSVRRAEIVSSGVTARNLIDNTVIRDLGELRKYEKRLKRLRETQAKMESKP